MARIVTERIVSDLSGKEIADGKAWVMTLTPPDGRRNPVRLDISEAEAQQWLPRGTEVKRRGRRPGSTAGRSRKTAAAPANGRRRKTSTTPANGRRRRKTTTAPANGRRRKKVAANGRRKRRTTS